MAHVHTPLLLPQDEVRAASLHTSGLCEQVNTLSFVAHDELKRIEAQIERGYAAAFCDANVQVAARGRREISAPSWPPSVHHFGCISTSPLSPPHLRCDLLEISDVSGGEGGAAGDPDSCFPALGPVSGGAIQHRIGRNAITSQHPPL